MTKLIDAKQFDGKLVKAWTEPTYRQHEYPDGGVRYETEPGHLYVVDETNDVLATVSGGYTLVQNRELVSALDLVADELDIRLEPDKGSYYNGKSTYAFTVPDFRRKIGGDPSNTDFSIMLRNDYRGNGSLQILAGWFRLLCGNGMMVGTISQKTVKRHVGEIDLYKWIKPALFQVHDRFEVESVIAETLAGTRLPGTIYGREWARGRKSAQEAVARKDATLVEALLAGTAERYHEDLYRAWRENSSAIGDNLWALAQAVSEVATHRMQEQKDGKARAHHNNAADPWATEQYEKIKVYAGIE